MRQPVLKNTSSGDAEAPDHFAVSIKFTETAFWLRSNSLTVPHCGMWWRRAHHGCRPSIEADAGPGYAEH